MFPWENTDFGKLLAPDLEELVGLPGRSPAQERQLTDWTLTPEEVSALPDLSPWQSLLFESRPRNRRGLLLLIRALQNHAYHKDEVHRFLARWGDHPFDALGRSAPVWCFFLGLQNDGQRETFLSAPAPCLKQLEKYCRRPHRAQAVAAGLRFLNLRFSAKLLNWFLDSPYLFARAAFALGSLERSHALQLLTNLEESALFTLDPETAPLLEAAEQMLEEGPISQNLLDYLEADREPSPAIAIELRESLVKRQKSLQLEKIMTGARELARAR